MFYVIRSVLDILTFPGVIIHEWSHKFFCNYFGVQVYKVKYFQFGKREAGYVTHEPARKFWQTFWISSGPIFINTLFALILSAVVFSIDGNIYDIKHIVLYWLAFSVGCHSFPSDADAGVVLEYSKNQIRNHFAIWHILTYPFFWVIYLLNFLRKFGFDYIYSVFLIFLAGGYIF